MIHTPMETTRLVHNLSEHTPKDKALSYQLELPLCLRTKDDGYL